MDDGRLARPVAVRLQRVDLRLVRVQAPAEVILVRQGKVAEPVGAMVISAPRGGVLFAVGGRDGELYVNGRALTRQWTDELRAKVPELSTDLDRLQAMRAEWLDSPPEDRTLTLAGACPTRTATHPTDRWARQSRRARATCRLAGLRSSRRPAASPPGSHVRRASARCTCSTPRPAPLWSRPQDPGRSP